jgi:hypothetical protein
MKNNSSGDVIKFLYNEMTATEAKSFKRKLEQDEALREECEALGQAMEKLDGCQLSPRASVLKNIMKYAKSPKSVEHQ